MVSGLVSVLRDAGLDVLLYNVGDVQDRRRFFQTLPARRKVDALVLVALPIADSERERLELMGVRIFAPEGKTSPTRSCASTTRPPAARP